MINEKGISVGESTREIKHNHEEHAIPREKKNSKKAYKNKGCRVQKKMLELKENGEILLLTRTT